MKGGVGFEAWEGQFDNLEGILVCALTMVFTPNPSLNEAYRNNLEMQGFFFIHPDSSS